MDPDSIRSIVLMIALVALSAYFSATETAFSTFNRIRVKNMAENGSKRAALVLKLSENYDRLLSTILVGNNLVNILLTTVATMFFADRIANEDWAAAVSTAVTTVVVLIFGEISPKSIAKDHPEGFAMATCTFVNFLMVLDIYFGWQPFALPKGHSLIGFKNSAPSLSHRKY